MVYPRLVLLVHIGEYRPYDDAQRGGANPGDHGKVLDTLVDLLDAQGLGYRWVGDVDSITSRVPVGRDGSGAWRYAFDVQDVFD